MVLRKSRFELGPWHRRQQILRFVEWTTNMHPESCLVLVIKFKYNFPHRPRGSISILYNVTRCIFIRREYSLINHHPHRRHEISKRTLCIWNWIVKRSVENKIFSTDLYLYWFISYEYFSWRCFFPLIMK